MQTNFLFRLNGCRTSRRITWLAELRILLWTVAVLAVATSAAALVPADEPARTWPQPYVVERDEATGILSLSTPYYTVQQDLKQGGAITNISLAHGRAANLLASPIEMRIRDADGAVFSDLNASSATVTHFRDGLQEVVTVQSALKDVSGRDSGLSVTSTIRYGWGFVRFRRELHAASGKAVREVCPFATVLTPSLTDFGYREGISEDEGAPPFAFGSNRWGKLNRDGSSQPNLQTRFVPRSMIFVDPGVEGLEWFAGSDLAQWECQLTGRRGDGQCLLQHVDEPAGWSLSIAPLGSSDAAVALPETSVFECYVAFPVREGRALGPWLHTTFNRNRGDWVTVEQIRNWAEKGIQTVHCHNDGDYYQDGLFWRDGSYPPYPDMDRYDRVLNECRRLGIRTATYFSNKELHPTAQEFQEHGSAWGRMNRKGDLQHNFYRPDSEFGVQMCLRSEWLDFLKFSIDRVLANHPLDGVYYDWNTALYCENPAHEQHGAESAEAKGHWDVEELLDLMQWTRQRVGKSGLIIVHNTTTPMFALENFADYVVATEWGYQKWTERAPDLQDLPLETTLAGAVPRGVISYGVLDGNAPARLHRLFAIEAFLNGMTPWAASDATFELLPLLKPLGNISDYRFADWRNQAVALSHPRCASAIYSRPGEAYLLLANLDPEEREVVCKIALEKLPCPRFTPTSATWLLESTATSCRQVPDDSSQLDLAQLLGEGLKLVLPVDGVLLIHLR